MITYCNECFIFTYAVTIFTYRNPEKDPQTDARMWLIRENATVPMSSTSTATQRVPVKTIHYECASSHLFYTFETSTTG